MQWKDTIPEIGGPDSCFVDFATEEGNHELRRLLHLLGVGVLLLLVSGVKRHSEKGEVKGHALQDLQPQLALDHVDWLLRLEADLMQVQPSDMASHLVHLIAGVGQRIVLVALREVPFVDPHPVALRTRELVRVYVVGHRFVALHLDEVLGELQEFLRQHD